MCRWNSFVPFGDEILYTFCALLHRYTLTFATPIKGSENKWNTLQSLLNLEHYSSVFPVITFVTQLPLKH